MKVAAEEKQEGVVHCLDLQSS